MIKKFGEFINEIYSETDTDTDSMVRAKTDLNQKESWIREYSSKRTILLNIFMTYQNEADFIQKLKARKLIYNFELDPSNVQRVKTTSVKDSKRMKFINPLLEEVAKIGDKKRQIKNLETDITEKEKTIDARQDSISRDAMLKPSFQEDIDAMTQKISDKNAKIEELKNEIKTLETQSRNKLAQMRREVIQLNKQIVDDIQDRKQTSIATEK